MLQSRLILQLSLISLLLMAAPAAQAQNIIVVIADDMGNDTLALYNEQPLVPPTPTIDALAQEGVFFRHAWAYPVCSPFRISVMTGRHPHEHRAGWGINSSWGRAYVLDPKRVNLAKELATVGYRTAAVGKFHMTNELGFTSPMFFDEILSATESAPNDLGYSHFGGFLFGGLNYFNWPKTINGVTSIVTTYATTDTTDEAIAQLGGSEPFFLWVAYNAPHGVIHIPPFALLDDPNIYNFTNGADQFRAMIEAMDTELGRIMALVDLTDTTVIFVGDNGTNIGLIEPSILDDHAKTTVYEGGLNVPLIIAGEAVALAAKDGESLALVQATDLFATILEIAALPVPDRDAVSLLPYLADPATPSARLTVFSEAFVPNGGLPDPVEHLRAAREVRYKLIRNGVDPEEFYDLDTDPYEQTPIDTGSLTAPEQAAYNQLAFTLDQMVGPSVPGMAEPVRAALGVLLVVLGVLAARARLARGARPRS